MTEIAVDRPAARCGSCGSPLDASIPARLCDSCLAAVSSGDAAGRREAIQAMDAAILLMQPEPRLVLTANDRALALFGKALEQAEGQRGGDVFGCVHSFTDAGCGKDSHCEDCKIRGAIVSGFSGAASAISTLTIRGGGGDLPYTLAVSAEKAGGYALVRIERFEPEIGGQHE